MCSSVDDWQSIVLFVTSAVSCLFGTPCSAIIILTIMKNRKFQTSFYFIIFNICMTDFFTSLFLSPLSMAISMTNLQSDNKTAIPAKEHIFRYSLTFLTTISVLSMGILCIDRLISLKMPKKYRRIKKCNFILALIFSWVLTGGVSIFYFFVNFIFYLTIMFLPAMFCTGVLMLMTQIIYRRKLYESYKRSNSIAQSNDLKRLSNVSTSENNSILTDSIYNKNSITQRELQEYLYDYNLEKRIVKTFLHFIIGCSVIFIPIFIMIVYVNFTPTICEIDNVFFKMIKCFLLIHSFVLPAIFLARLTALRKSSSSLFLTTKQIERRWRAESVPVVLKRDSTKEGLIKHKRYQNDKSSMATSI